MGLLLIHSLYQHKSKELHFLLPLMITLCHTKGNALEGEGSSVPEAPCQHTPLCHAGFCPLCPGAGDASGERTLRIWDFGPCTASGGAGRHPSWWGNTRANTPWGCQEGKAAPQVSAFPIWPGALAPHFPHPVPTGMLNTSSGRRLPKGWIHPTQPSLQPTHQPLPYHHRGSSSALNHPAPQAGGNSPPVPQKWLFPAGRWSKPAAGRGNTGTSGQSPSHGGLWGLSRRDEPGDATALPGAPGGQGSASTPVQSKPQSTGTKCCPFAEPGPDGDPGSAAQCPHTQPGLSPPSSSPPLPGEGQTRPRRRARSAPGLSHPPLWSCQPCPSQRVSGRAGGHSHSGVGACSRVEQGTAHGLGSTRGCVAGDSSGPGSGRRQPLLGGLYPPALPHPVAPVEKRNPHPSTHTPSCQLLKHLEPKDTFLGTIRKFLFAAMCPRGLFGLPQLSAFGVLPGSLGCQSG